MNPPARCCAAWSRCPTAAASPDDANSAKQVGPDPDMRASRTPGTARKRASTSAMTGTQAIAPCVRSFPCCARNAIIASWSRGTSAILFLLPGALKNLANTSRVAKGTPGLTSTAGNGGRSSGGDSRSPTPRMMRGRDARHTGTSAPSSSAAAVNRGSSSASPFTRARRRNAAAASAEPPPMPAATGIFFSSRKYPAVRPSIRWRRPATALSTRLSAVDPLGSANGPEMSSAVRNRRAAR